MYTIPIRCRLGRGLLPVRLKFGPLHNFQYTSAHQFFTFYNKYTSQNREKTSAILQNNSKYRLLHHTVITTKELAIQKHQTSLRFFEVQSGALVKERNIVLNFGKISPDNKIEQLGTEC